ncbi:unnamed protein product [Paramecium primaurelia]|uniref:Uncharacterized protein n=1 Tax=Paramecium primaurelia TaxID=5886 RepID=A0A8S1MX00_PARPR|nr:unnamed protein product [Paramecium primaurelia]
MALLEVYFWFSVLQLEQCSECSKLIRKQDCEYGNCLWSTDNEIKEGIFIDSGSNVDQGNSEHIKSSTKLFQSKRLCLLQFKLHNFYRLLYIFIPSMLRLSTNIVIPYIRRRLRKFVKIQDVRVLNDEYQRKIGSCHCKWDSGNQKCRDEFCSEAGIGLIIDQKFSKFRLGCITKDEWKTDKSSGQDCSKQIGLYGPFDCLLNFQKKLANQIKENQIPINIRKISILYINVQKKCETASITQRKEKQCDQYLKGCVSTGRGCVEKLWPQVRILEVEFVKMDYSIQLRIAKNIKLVKLLQENHGQLLCKIVQVIREIKILVCDQQIQRGCIKEQMIINRHVLQRILSKIVIVNMWQMNNYRKYRNFVRPIEWNGCII